jgi:hypothetical protein
MKKLVLSLVPFLVAGTALAGTAKVKTAKAATTLTTVRAGEKVKVTFRDGAAGDHEAVTSIRPSGYGKGQAKAKTSTTH